MPQHIPELTQGVGFADGTEKRRPVLKAFSKLEGTLDSRDRFKVNKRSAAQGLAKYTLSKAECTLN